MIGYFKVINRYASNLICIFMNINEDIRNNTKYGKNERGLPQNELYRSEYDQEIPQSQNADKAIAPQG